MKKNILILGATGSIGKDLTMYLSEKYNIIALSRNLNELKFLKNKNVKIAKHDFKNKFKTSLKIDYIINCIVTHAFSKKNSIDDYINSNIVAASNMISLAQEKKIKLIINLSSVSVYGKPKADILKEDTPIFNNDLLGYSKLFVEKLLELQNINYINLRLPGILNNNFDKNRPWLNTLIHKIKKKDNFSIFNGNSNFNNLITTSEIHRFIEFLINGNIKIRDTFNFSASKPIKLLTIINKIKVFYNSNSKIINISNNKSSIVSIKKFNKNFKYTIATTSKMLDYYLNNLKN